RQPAAVAGSRGAACGQCLFDLTLANDHVNVLRTNGATAMPAAKMRNLVEPGHAADIPSVDRLLNARAFQALVAQHGRTQVIAALRTRLDSLRHAALAGGLPRASLAGDAIAAAVGTTLADAARLTLRPVFNLTGTVLHTNLGRALLPEEAVRAVAQALTAPVNLEFDLKSGFTGAVSACATAPTASSGSRAPPR